MYRYDDNKGDNQKWCNIKEIVVDSEESKQQLIAAIHYLHDAEIDTDYLAVNSLVHMYQFPEKIKVK